MFNRGPDRADLTSPRSAPETELLASLLGFRARYGLDGWKPAQTAHFGRVHFGPLAGLAQQYLFAWERRFGRTSARTPE